MLSVFTHSVFQEGEPKRQKSDDAPPDPKTIQDMQAEFDDAIKELLSQQKHALEESAKREKDLEEALEEALKTERARQQDALTELKEVAKQQQQQQLDQQQQQEQQRWTEWQNWKWSQSQAWSPASSWQRPAVQGQHVTGTELALSLAAGDFRLACRSAQANPGHMSLLPPSHLACAGQYPLHQLAHRRPKQHERQYVNEILVQIAKQQGVLDHCNQNGSTAAHMCAGNGNLELFFVERFLKKKLRSEILIFCCLFLLGCNMFLSLCFF